MSNGAGRNGHSHLGLSQRREAGRLSSPFNPGIPGSAVLVMPLSVILLFLLFMAIAGPSVAASPPSGTAIVNTVTLRWADAAGNPQIPLRAQVSTIVTAGPMVRVRKLGSSDPIAVGATITYTLKYENTGNAPATNLRIVDRLPPQVMVGNTTGTLQRNQPAAPDTLTWLIPEIGAGGKGTVSFEAIVATDPAIVKDGDRIVNTAEASTDQTGSSTILVTTVGRAPSLEIEIIGSQQQITSGQEIEYRVTWRNTGNMPANGTWIRTALPPQTALVADSITGGGSESERVILWNLGTVPMGGSGSFFFRVRVSSLAAAGAILGTQAIIACQELEARTSAAVAAVVQELSALVVSKQALSTALTLGETAAYALTVSNPGNTALTNVIVRDHLPSGTAFLSASDGGTVWQGTAIWMLSRLAASESRKLTLQLRVTGLPADGVLLNTVTAISNQTDVATASALLSIAGRQRPLIEFIDADGTSRTWYPSTGDIFIRVTDPAGNRDPGAAETVTVRLTGNGAGDGETVTLTETGPNTGVFTGKIPTTPTAAKADDGGFSVKDGETLTVVYAPPEFAGQPAIQDLALVNPSCVLFDSLSGSPIKGATVVLVDAATGLAATLTDGSASRVTTGDDGRFRFLAIPPGNYYLEIQPGSDFVYPSTVADSALPSGFTIKTGSKRETFAIIGEPGPISFDVPVDRAAQELRITKTADKFRASIGEFVTYTVTLTNGGQAPVTGIRLRDILPHGLGYMKGSSRIKGGPIADPALAAARTLDWTVPDLAPRDAVTLSYLAVITIDAPQGPVENLARATGDHLGRAIVSRTASCKIELREGLFTERGIIIGKVFWDHVDPRTQHSTAVASEPGIPGAVLYLENGMRVETDGDGRFTLVGVTPGAHVLRLDRASLPEGFRAVETSNRHLGDPWSQIVDIPHGGLWKANFAVIPPTGWVLPLGTPTVEFPGIDPLSESLTGAPPAMDNFKGVPTGSSATPVPSAGEPDWTAALASPSAPEAGTATLEILSPRPGVALPGLMTRVAVKSHLEGKVTLRVNDLTIGEGQVGKVVADATRGRKITEFIGVPLKPDTQNHLVVTMADSFGNVREKRELLVETVGDPTRIECEALDRQVPADGRSSLRVRISLRDARGRVTGLTQPLTVDSTIGQILTTDLDPALEGCQVAMTDGRAECVIRAPNQSGQGRLTILGGNLRQTADLIFIPHLRDLLFLGLGEFTIGRANGSGDLGPLRDRTHLTEGTWNHGRGAFFAKGRIGRDLLLTTSFDSDKRVDTELFRMGEADLNLEYKYPLEGDGSRMEFETVSRDRFYLRLERRRSSLLYGDYHTGLDKTRLAAYSRMFHGWRLDLHGRRTQLESFFTRTDSSQVIDTLAARGISGYYLLSNGRIIPGSERVTIETRMRWRPELVLKRLVKQREVDYEVDYVLGAVTFKGPVPSVDADLNPQFVIVTYETRSEAPRFEIYGGRGSVEILPRLELGATLVTERQLAGDSRIEGLDMTWKLPRDIEIRGELARTHGLFDQDNTLQMREGLARAIEIKGRPSPDLEFAGYYRKAAADFRNPSAYDAFPGSARHGFDASWKFGRERHFALKLSHFLEDDFRNDMYYRSSSVGLEKTLARSRFGLAWLQEASRDNYLPAGRLLSRHPFDIAEQTPRSLEGLRLSADHALNDRLDLQLSHKFGVGGEAFRLSRARLNYRLNDPTSLYVSHENARFDTLADERLVTGVESRIGRRTAAFSEYRMGTGTTAERIQKSIGLTNAFNLGRSATGNLTFEKLDTVKGPQLQQEPDATALSVGIEYLPLDRLKATTRYERRFGNQGTMQSADLGLAYSVGRGLQLMLRDQYYHGSNGDAGMQTSLRRIFGAAWRPTRWDRFNALAKVEQREGLTGDFRLGTDARAEIVSFDGTYQAGRRLHLVGRFAQKRFTEMGFSDLLRLVSSRLVLDLGDRYDFAYEYRIMKDDATDARLAGSCVELGLRLRRNVWLGLGYSFERFDADLIGDRYQGDGPFLRIRFKALEDWFSR